LIFLEKGKGALIGREIPDETNLLYAVTEILNGLSTENCNAFFVVESNALKM
jgi:hypothetical protein